jgi:hypothetical protein
VTGQLPLRGLVPVPAFLATLSFLLGTGVPALDFWYSRHARLLHLLTALHPPLCGAAILIAFRHFRSSQPVWPGEWRERLVVVLCAALCTVLIALPALLEFYNQQSGLIPDLDALTGIPGWRRKSFVFTFLGTTSAAVLSTGVFGVHVQLLRCLPETPPRAGESQGEGLEEEVRRYQRLRSQLGQFLSLSAALIGLVILNMGVLRNLLQEVAPALLEVLPTAGFMGYGLYYSGLLASAYLPAHKTLTAVGEGLAERLVLQSSPARTNWKEWTEEHQAVRGYLGLQGSALQDLQQGLTVLSPLLASLSSLLLGVSG